MSSKATNSSSSSSPENEEIIPGWLWWSVIGLVVFTLILVTTYSGLTSKWKADYNAEIQKLKNNGIPYSTSSLQRAYKKRCPNQKAYDSWSVPKALENRLEKIEFRRKRSRKRRSWSRSPIKKRKKKARNVLSLLEHHKKTISNWLVEQPHPVSLKFSQGLTLKLPHVQERYTEAQILSFYAKALIDTGQLSESIPVVRKLYELGKTLRKSPLFITAHTGFSITEKANESVELMLSKRTIPKNLSSVFATTDASSIQKHMLHALHGERVVIGVVQVHKFIQRRSTLIGKRLSSGDVLSYFPRSTFWLPATIVLKDFRTVENLYKQPYYRSKSRLKTFRKKLTNRSKGTLGQFRSFFTWSYPPFNSVLQKGFRTKVRLELLQRAVRAKLRSQREDSGLMPVPDLKHSTDPFSGKPYKVKETKSYVILYSIGSNLKDDGGSISATVTNEPKDVGVRIPKTGD